MVKYLSNEFDLIFYALSDSTRRQILALLGHGAKTVSEIAKPFSMSLPAISKHIKILEDAKLLSRRKEGRQYFCSLDARALRSAEQCLQFYKKFWSAGLDSLENELTKKEK